MGRYSDERSVGRSRTVPFKQGETASDRHARRKEAAEHHLEEFRAWCEAHLLRLTIKNDGHHWIIQGREIYAEWWPSSAKLVLDRRYQKGIHCHDVDQLRKLIEKEKRRRD